MSDDTPPPSGTAGDVIRPLSVRLLDSARAQLEVLAQLNGRSLTAEVRLALEAWLERSKTDPDVMARAAEVRSEIERDAEVRRLAIEAIFAPASPARSKRGTTEPK